METIAIGIIYDATDPTCRLSCSGVHISRPDTHVEIHIPDLSVLVNKRNPTHTKPPMCYINTISSPVSVVNDALFREKTEEKRLTFHKINAIIGITYRIGGVNR